MSNAQIDDWELSARCSKHNHPFAPCPYCQIENKDSLIDKLTALTKQLTAENERLRTFLSDILVDAVDMGNYYHVKYEAVEQAADALEASIWEES